MSQIGLNKRLLLVGILCLLGQQMLFAQDALTSIKINVQNFVISSDAKTISYDVYIQDVDPSNVVAIPGFIFKLAVPIADLGTGLKTVSITNYPASLGIAGDTMYATNDRWLMKFTQANLITSYANALLLSETFPGTRIGTFNFSNANGEPFTTPLSLTALWAGSSPSTKSTVTIFKYNTTYPAPNGSAAQPESNFSGLGNKILTAGKKQLTVSGTIASSKPYDGTTTATLTLGTIDGINSSDVGNVTVVATGAYENAGVGTNKNIAVSYSISGSAAGNYLAPVDTTLLNGIITKKPLTIGNPTFSLSKMYDGTTTAAVTTLGSLNGVLPGESVVVSGTGAYATANAGGGKTITVSYSLSGANAANYQAPDNFTVNNGEIIRLFTAKAFYEGLFDATNIKMLKCKDYDTALDAIVDKFTGDVVDTVSILLYNSSYTEVAHSLNNLLLHQDGSITSEGASSILVPASIAGSYRITIKSRNHLETTSANLVSFDENAIVYDFTNSQSKAYSSSPDFAPTKQINGKWTIYAGDVFFTDTDNPEINMNDVFELFNNRSASTDVYGYSKLDLNGDGFIDDSDVYLLFENNKLTVYLFIEE